MHNQVRTNEWYTPFEIVEAARRTMGHIDLDPASSDLANTIVQAANFYTEEQDGLSLPWYGKVWLNPPFGRVNGGGESRIKLFTLRLVDKYRKGEVEEAILLSTVQPNATWFHPLTEYPMCFTRKRVHFYRPGPNGELVKNSRDSHMLGTALVYLGKDVDWFVENFEQFGPVFERRRVLVGVGEVPCL